MRGLARRALRAALLVGLGAGAAACAQLLGADFGDYQKACAADAACDDGDPCTVDACGAEGQCTHEAASDGDAPDALQRHGDCVKAYCLGGVLTAVDDDGDVSDDGSACTADSCASGRAMHTTQPDDSACTSGSAAGLCKAGVCVVECGPKLPPCDDGDRCTSDTCDGTGRCQFAPLADQPIPGAVDAPGDCKRPRCVGGVEVVGATDDGDLPTSASDCVTPTCAGGVASLPPLPAGTACGSSSGAVCDEAGACVECDSEADCVGLPPSDECQTRTCKAHVCGSDPVPADTALGAQTPGDCQTRVCDGAGHVTSKNDDGDLPTEGGDCVQHLCDAGAPKTPPVAAGTSCGGGGVSVCDGAGSCVGCNAPSDCAGVDDDCKARTCVAHTCGFDYAPNNTPLPAGKQTPGDCKTLACNGAGATKALSQPDDVPNDQNPCTTDLCIASNPQHTAVAVDTACPGGFCDGAGSCGQCNKAAQCPLPPVCKAAACTAHVCGTTNVGLNVNPGAGYQVVGDCRDLVCDGAGGTMPKLNQSDLPNDGNQCTADTCSVGGLPTYTPRPAHYACSQNGGFVCDGAAKCVGCVDGSDCAAPTTCGGGNPGTPNVCGCTKKTCAQAGLTCGTGSDGCGSVLACDDGAKNGTETDVDCGGGTSCPTKCGAGKVCGVDTDCASGFCGGGLCN